VTDLLDPEAPTRHALYLRSNADRVADVCPTCGMHIIQNVVARLKWIIEGGEVKCVSCNITKVRVIGDE
jgi:hypothetical protein